MKTLMIYPIENLPEVSPGEDLAKLIVQVTEKAGRGFRDGDVLVIAQKIVSKAEGRVVDLSKINPSTASMRLSKILNKDPRIVELILKETKRIVRMSKGVIICETKHGFVCANGGIDQSNVPEGKATLLPKNPDKSAQLIREAITKEVGGRIAVIISDTFGRPWREGQTDIAIGVAGMKPIRDYRGMKDKHGYKLKATMMSIADELASAAELVMGKMDDIPAAIIRGYDFHEDEGTARELIRKATKDLFR